MHSEVAWVLVSLGTQVQRQIIFEPGYVPDYLPVSFDFVYIYWMTFTWKKESGELEKKS